MKQFLMTIVLFFFNILYPVKIYGKENMPKGPAVLACNHFRAIDPGFCLRANLKMKEMHFLAKKELFRKKFVSGIIKWVGGVPIDREKPEMGQMMSIIKMLKEGKKIVIYPEGTRNKENNELQEISSGAVFFALKAKVKIIPMMMLDRAKLFKKTRLIIGKPIDFSEYYGKKLSNEEMEELTRILREKMINEQENLKVLLSTKKAK